MTELIKITEQNGRRAVSARELHYFLESSYQFSDWIKTRIERFGFVEGQDFEVFQNFLKNPLGGRPLTEYALSIDMAKELCMLENNDKGRELRRYFIEAEKKARNPFGIPTTYKEALQVTLQQLETIEQQQAQIEAQQDTISEQQASIEENAPRVLYAKAVETNEGNVSVGTFAKMLCQNGVSTGQNRLFLWFRQNNYLGSCGSYYNVPTQKSMELGLFDIAPVEVSMGPNKVIKYTPTITGKGQLYFMNKFLKGKQASI